MSELDQSIFVGTPDDAPKPGDPPRVIPLPGIIPVAAGGERPVEAALDIRTTASETVVVPDNASSLIDTADNIADLPVPTVESFKALDNPYMKQHNQEHKGGRKWYVAAGVAGAAAVATLATLLSGGGSHKSADQEKPTKGPATASASLTPKAKEVLPLVDADAALSPDTLNTAFLDLVVTDGSKAAADESYQYFDAALKSRMSQVAWEGIVAKTQPFFKGHTATLRNGPTVLAAATTHAPVVANNFLRDGRGNDVVLVDESYDPATKQWQIDSYRYEGTDQTQ